jgi:ketosteroid isomerase-like protein
VVSDESTTPDLEELARRSVEAFNRRDLDAALSVYGPNSIWDNSAFGLETNEGFAAIRQFIEDWYSSYEELEIEIEENVHLGNGVLLAVAVQKGRPVGSTGHLEVRYAVVFVFAGGIIERAQGYTDIDEARAAAERLAQERG